MEIEDYEWDDFDETPVMVDCPYCGETFNHDDNPDECPYCEEAYP